MIKKTICLNMIVKNESKIIEKTLKNLSAYINFDYWVICDTGSTDNTKEIIKNFFKRLDISGELIEHEWKNFGHNRTLALNSAYNKTDFLFLFDADDKIVGDFKLPEFILDKYLYKFGTNDYSYLRPNLINNRKRWKFIGVLHEFLNNIDSINGEQIITGDYHIEIGTFGARSNCTNKYLKDALLLEKAYIKETDIILKNRYAFYCAQSYKDCNFTDKAIEWYLKILDLQNWCQEKYYACIQLGNFYLSENKIDKAIEILSRSVEYDNERIECIMMLMKCFYTKNNHLLINSLYNKYKNYEKYNYTEKLFLNFKCWIEFEYYNSISAFYVKDLIGGFNSCKKLLYNYKTIDKQYIEITLNNMIFYKDQFKCDNNREKLNNILIELKNSYKHPNIDTILNA